MLLNAESAPVYNKIYISNTALLGILKHKCEVAHSLEEIVIPVLAFYLLKEAEMLNYVCDWKRLIHKHEQKAPGASIETACV